MSEIKDEVGCEILMSPLLSAKFEKIDAKLKTITESIQNINVFLEENRQMYSNMLTSITEVSNENKRILSENRKLYTDALKKIEETEKQNMNELRPIIDTMNVNTKTIEENITSTMLQSRIYNRYWRLNHFNSNTKFGKFNGILNKSLIPEINNILEK